VSNIVALYGRLRVDVRDEIPALSFLELRSCSGCGLLFFEPSRQASSAFYARLSEFDWYYANDKEEFRSAACLVNPGENVLDVGCGIGEFKTFLPHAEYVGLELSENACAAAAHRGRDVRNESVACHAAYAAGRYDTVVSFQVLEHVTDVRGFLDGCLACLKPGGRLIISVPSEDSFGAWMTNAQMNLPPHHWTRWKDCALIRAADVLGIDLIDLHHESLPRRLRDLYAETMLRATLFRLFRRPIRTVDMSGFRKWTAWAKVLAPLAAPFFFLGSLPWGLSAIAVYRKRGAGVRLSV
jgi:SAM-dependent methyltransferase